MRESTPEGRVTAAGRLAGRLLLASRPVSWINTAFPFTAAMLLTTGEVDARLVVGTLFFLAPYNLAMYGINDVFDYASDARNPRKGGSEGALLPPSTHRAVLGWAVGGCIPFVIAMALLGGPASWVALAVSLFAVAAYSMPPLRWKEVPGLDSITSSTHFVSPAVYGLVLADATWTPPLFAFIAAFTCWGMASHAFGAVQDVVPDRETGIRSIATALGARATVRLAIGLWVIAGLLMLLTPWPATLGALLTVPYLWLAAPFWCIDDDSSAEANRGWRRFLWVNYACGFAVTLLCVAWAVGAP